MSDTECVIFAFFPFGKSAESAFHPVFEEGLPPACQYLVSIGLMPHIEYDLVSRGVEYIMKSDNEFHSTQTRAEMPRIRRTTVYDVLTDLGAQLFELRIVKLSYIFRSIDIFQHSKSVSVSKLLQVTNISRHFIFQ